MTRHTRSSRRRFQKYQENSKKKAQTRRKDKVLAWHSQERSAQRTRSFGELFRTFLGRLAPYRKSMAIALGTLTIATILSLIPPVVTKFAVDQVFNGEPLPETLLRLVPGSQNIPKTPVDQLMILVGIVVVVSVISTLLGITGRWKATQTVKRLQSSMRHEAFDHASKLPLHKVQELTSGGATSLIREDAGGVADLVFAMIYNPWRAIIQLLGSLTVLAFVDWRLLVGAVTLFPLIWYTHRTWIGRIRPMYRDIRMQRQEIDSHATESFGGMRVVRGFARSRSESSRYVTGNHVMLRKEIYVWWWARGVELAWSLLLPMASAALLWFGGKQVIDGTITTGDLVMFLAYLAMLFGPIETLANSATMFQTNLAGLDRVLDLVEEPREMPDVEGAREIRSAQVEGRMRLENLSFNYPDSDMPALEGLSFEVEPGSLVALVGRSGAGKTTCCNLVARFYDPTGGRILLDGEDIRDITLDSYRRLLGIVEQDVFLFDGTVRSNIGYGRRGATDEEILRAAELAAADDFIEALPNGLDTVIGERGFKLSGGQRQRLAIARAILADPRILILDEATSNLDTESEKKIQEGLTELMRGRTSFVIAHRLSTIMHADLIVVLGDGRVLETGRHDELMQTSGAYRRMVVLQSENKE
jgi:ATP-binding cassette subfamily B protein